MKEIFLFSRTSHSIIYVLLFFACHGPILLLSSLEVMGTGKPTIFQPITINTPDAEATTLVWTRET